MHKLPPIEKIYEAYSAIVDDRVQLYRHYAVVTSSNREKSYMVTWGDSFYAANDNATYWQGYAGYPIIAVLMLRGELPFNMKIAKRFANINWSEQNAKAKRNYALAVENIFRQQGIDERTKNKIRMEAKNVYEMLNDLNFEIKRVTKRLEIRVLEKEKQH